MTSCMGGWCTRREKCHLHAAATQPIRERVCLLGRDGQQLVPAENGTGSNVMDLFAPQPVQMAADDEAWRAA